MDHEYAQPAVLMFDKLPIELICRLIVSLNGGTIDNGAKPEYGYLYPGFQGGRELIYFKISRDAMTFWKHVCKYLRHTHTINNQAHDILLSDNAPRFCDYQEHHERYVPRHLYAGNPKPWMMRLCYGPQTHEAVEQAKIAAEARKEKRRTDAAIALVAGWGSGQRRLRART